jgi:hypothetical protein
LLPLNQEQDTRKKLAPAAAPSPSIREGRQQGGGAQTRAHDSIEPRRAGESSAKSERGRRRACSTLALAEMNGEPAKKIGGGSGREAKNERQRADGSTQLQESNRTVVARLNSKHTAARFGRARALRTLARLETRPGPSAREEEIQQTAARSRAKTEIQAAPATSPSAAKGMSRERKNATGKPTPTWF